MALPDIKGAGVLSDVVHFGTPHHGLLDGTVLDDGADGVSHPALSSYKQRNGLWITPTLKHIVPGFTPPPLPIPAIGAEWLDYGIMSGMTRALYKKEIFVGATTHGYWMASFGSGDTWRCAITSAAVGVGASGGSASVALKLTRFGRMEKPPVTEEIINLTGSLAPAGQPAFVGDETDFSTTSLKLVVLDVAEDGTRAIVAVMPFILDYYGYSAPRGLLLLTFSKTAATLELLKSRSDMLVSVDREITSSSMSGGISEADLTCSVPRTLVVPDFNYDRVITHTAVNLVGAYFDAAGAVEYLRATITKVDHDSSVYGGWTMDCVSCSGGSLESCSPPAQTILSTVTFAREETAVVEKLVAGGTLVTATSNRTVTSAGTHTAVDGSWVNDATVTDTLNQTSISGRVTSSSSSVASTQTTTSLPENGATDAPFKNYPEYTTVLYGTLLRAPYEFTGTEQFPITMVGFGGLLGHVSSANIEASLLHARSGVGGYVAVSDSAIVSVHPHTGELAKKTGSWTSPPSFGWV